MSQWFKEITVSYKTGHVVALDLFKALSFFAGLFYLLVLVPVVVLSTATHLVLPLEGGFFLVANGFGLQVLKEGAKYFARKTEDANGALAVPATDALVEPVEPMPS